MKVSCDVQLPYRLVHQLRQQGVDATHANRYLNGSETQDAAVTGFADANDMVLITMDSNFHDSHLPTGPPSRPIRVTLGNLPNAALLALFDEHWEALARALAVSPRCFELGSDGVVVYE